MWLANFEDGGSITSKNIFWTQLREKINGRRLSGLQLFCPLWPNFSLCVKNMDFFYFSYEAVAAFSPSTAGAIKNDVVAEVIGGHLIDKNVGVEMKLELSGCVKTRLYDLSRFRYSKDILVPGIGE